jgi:carboxylesterase
MTHPIIAGAEPWSHVGNDTRGALVLHGFTGSPGSVREVAEVLAAAGFHIELPLLPGHGTVVEEMMPTRWSDWAGGAEAAFQRLAQRATEIVVVGLSMGGALTLKVGADHPEVAGLVCVNPVTQPQAAEIVDLLRGMLDGGATVIPGIGSDIADPSASEVGYADTPIESLLSLLLDGVEPLSHRYPQMRPPLLLMHSPQDHVVDPVQSEFLAERYAGPLERITLEHSYHVATQDYDKELVFKATVEFAERVTAQ